MEREPDEELAKLIPMADLVLTGNSQYFQICPAFCFLVYWQDVGNRPEVTQSEYSQNPVLEDFLALRVNGKVLYDRLQNIENNSTNEAEKQHDLKQEMIKSHTRQLLIDLLDSYSKWENQYSFDSAEKAAFLANTIKSLYEEIIRSVECESFKDEQATFKEDQERITQARKEFEKILIKLGFSGIPYTRN